MTSRKKVVKQSLFLVLSAVNLLTLHTASADPLFEDHTLNAFVEDLIDRNTVRHYELVNKQSAIHKWLISECMQDRGLTDDASVTPQEWQNALYGKYAYCQDHHIPGIDPPCPSESVVEESVNQSCYKSQVGRPMRCVTLAL